MGEELSSRVSQEYTHLFFAGKLFCVGKVFKLKTLLVAICDQQ